MFNENEKNSKKSDTETNFHKNPVTNRGLTASQITPSTYFSAED